MRRAPHSSRKHRAILEAATEAFLESGYGAATMDDIAARAKVSKQTIYHHFGSKEALFGAIIEQRVESFLAPISQAELAPGDMGQSLRRFGQDFLERVLSSSSLALHRLIIAESNRFPELGRLTYETGPRRIVSRLARFLEAQKERSGLRIDDPDISAEQFYGSLLGFLQLRAILCNDPESSRDRIAGYVDRTVDAFLKSHLR